MKRVVVTGMAGISPLGNDWPTVSAHLRSLKNAISYQTAWDKFEGLNTRLGGVVKEFKLPEHYKRKRLRSMGRVSVMATRATEIALEDAGLLDDPSIQDGRMGIAYGSSSGTPDAIADFANMLINNTVDGLSANTYIKMMNHTAAVNIGVFFGLTGRIIPTSSACTSGSQGIGYAYEAIRFGRQQMMIAGGAEELSATQAAVFDTLFATSTCNDEPQLTPRPYDAHRDGLVIGEGACTLILEDLESARARGAHIYAEIVGFGSNSDGKHVTQPDKNTMARALQIALSDAKIPPEEIGYVCGHGTATEHGDIAETLATEAVFKRPVPISSLKSYTGHMLGGCASFESWCAIEMMRANWFAPTINLDQVDERCGDLDYIKGSIRENCEVEYVMNNNFAFGGINTSLIFKRWR